MFTALPLMTGLYITINQCLNTSLVFHASAMDIISPCLAPLTANRLVPTQPLLSSHRASSVPTQAPLPKVKTFPCASSRMQCIDSSFTRTIIVGPVNDVRLAPIQFIQSNSTDNTKQYFKGCSNYATLILFDIVREICTTMPLGARRYCPIEKVIWPRNSERWRWWRPDLLIKGPSGTPRRSEHHVLFRI